MISLPPPAALQLGSGGDGQELTMLPVLDRRPDPSRRTDVEPNADPATVLISYSEEKKGSFRETPIRLNKSVAVWVGEGFVAALKQSGFRVERAKALASAPSPLALTVAVRTVSLQAPLQSPEIPFLRAATYTAEARILTRVELYRRGELMQTRTYSGTSVSPPTDWASLEKGPLLPTALNDMLRKAMPDLAAAIARETPERSDSGGLPH